MLIGLPMGVRGCAVWTAASERGRRVRGSCRMRALLLHTAQSAQRTALVRRPSPAAAQQQLCVMTVGPADTACHRRCINTTPDVCCGSAAPRILSACNASAATDLSLSLSLSLSPISSAATALLLTQTLPLVSLASTMLQSHPQAEASQLVATVAAAAEGYPFVPPEWMPSVLVPTVGLIVPAIGMAWVSARGAFGAASARASHNQRPCSQPADCSAVPRACFGASALGCCTAKKRPSLTHLPPPLPPTSLPPPPHLGLLVDLEGAGVKRQQEEGA